MKNLQELTLSKLVVDESDIRKLKKEFSNQYVFESINPKLKDDYIADGWEHVKDYKTTTKVKKLKTPDRLLEERMWVLLSNMGYSCLNKDRLFKLPYGNSESETHQIDVFAKGDDTIIIVECKASTSPNKTVCFKKEIESYKGILSGLYNSIHSVFNDKKYKVKFVFATDGYEISDDDKNRLDSIHRALHDTIPQLVNANNQEERLIAVCRYLDNLQGKRGFVYKNYCCGSLKTCGFERMYFTPQNGQKCDAIRHIIEDWFRHELITREEYFYLLATLIENIDKVANTASVYGAFLKHYKKNAQKRMVMEPLSIHLSNLQHQVYCEDANELAKRISADIIYIDPPYNERQYSAYYHVLETIARNDKPLLHGKTGLRDYNTQKSNYCYKDKVLRTFADLIANVCCQYIFVSYNSDGLMTPDEIETILRTKGDYHCFSRTYTRYRADKLDARQYKQTEVVEYIHCCEVNN